MFKSFQAKLVVTFVTLIAIVQLITFVAVYNATSYNVVTQIKDQLLYTGGTFNRHLTEQAQRLSESTRILTSDFAFREAIAAGDRATSLSVIRNHGARIKADRVMLISLDNIIVSDTGRSEQANAMFPFEQLINTADENGFAQSIIVLDGALYEFVVVPVLAPVPIAWIGIGVQIDDAAVSNLKMLSPLALDISFLQYDRLHGWTLLVSTLEPTLYPELPAITQSLAAQTKPNTTNANAEKLWRKMEPTNTRLAGNDYVTLIMPLVTPEKNPPVIALLQYPLEIAMGSYRPLLFWLILLAASGLLLTIIGGVFIGRGVTKPVRTLVDAAYRIEQGNYKQPVELKQKDELGHLADTFNSMMEGISGHEEKIRYQAHHDALTGLPNRLQFEHIVQSHIDKENNNQERFCVILVSIDRLQDINNTLGHQVGDQLIQLIGKRLQLTLKDTDTLARFSNDAFTILVAQNGADISASITESIHRLFEKPFAIEDINVDVNVKIGMSLFPDHGNTSNILLRKADIAMYTAQQEGQRYAVYDAEKDTYSRDRLSLMSELKLGLKNGDFQLYYQPKFDIINKQVTHAEALIRWIHPTRGFMPPDDFIPLAEQTGHIKKLSLWVLEQSILQCSEWQKSGIDMHISVNLSVKDLMSQKLPAIIRQLLIQYQLDPECLVLEITESSIMQDPDVALEVLAKLRNIGLKISIDDFGTGYSSMEYLKKLPANILKVDKSFVMKLSQNQDDKIIVRSMIQLAHSLGLKVVAEGVEDEESLNILTGNGCDYAQGYFISRPLPIEEFNQWLATSEWSKLGIPDSFVASL